MLAIFRDGSDMDESDNIPRSHDEMEAQAGEVIGRIVFAFSRFEFNLGLCLRNLVGGTDPESANPLVARLTFNHKLDAMIDVVEHKFASKPECIDDFKKWHRAISALRTKRNSFVHGRWGILEYDQKIVNVAPGLPGGAPQREKQFALGELQQEFEGIQRVISDFLALRKKWRI